MLLAIVGCVTVMAGDDIKLSEGSVAPLKEGGVASLVIDMADTQFDNKTAKTGVSLMLTNNFPSAPKNSSVNSMRTQRNSQ